MQLSLTSSALDSHGFNPRQAELWIETTNHVDIVKLHLGVTGSAMTTPRTPEEMRQIVAGRNRLKKFRKGRDGGKESPKTGSPLGHQPTSLEVGTFATHCRSLPRPKPTLPQSSVPGCNSVWHCCDSLADPSARYGERVLSRRIITGMGGAIQCEAKPP